MFFFWSGTLNKLVFLSSASPMSSAHNGSVSTYISLFRELEPAIYSGTSHNEHSEKRTTSVQRTKSMTRIEFSIALILNEPPRSGQPLYNGQSL